MTLIYIGDNLVDLYPDTVISLTIQKIDIGDLSRRNINYTNNIKLPWTENNARIFGYSFDERSYSSIPYTLMSCKIVQNGVEILSNANCILSKSYRGKSFSINIYENVFDYFHTIKGKVLSDINPIADSAWNAAGIDAARTNTSGIVSAVLHWGKPEAFPGEIYQVNYFLPCFYYHTIITEILEFTGLSISGSILTDARFTDLVIPFPGKEFLYPQSLVDGWSASAYNSSNPLLIGQVLTGIRVVQVNTFNYGSSNFISSVYYAPDNINLSITITIQFTAFTWNAATFLEIEVLKNSATVLDNYTVAGGTGSTGLLTLEYTGDFVAGDTIHLNLRSDVASVPNGVDCTVAQNWAFVVSATRTINRADVKWNYLWPEIKCEDLLRDFFTRFSIIPKLVGNTLVLESIEDIITDRVNIIDWSGKLVNVDDVDIEMDSSYGYGMNNNFDYQDSEDVGQPELGRGVIEIDNDTLEDEKEIYSSLFGNSLITEEIFNYRVALISVYDADSTGIDTFAMEPGLRLLTLKARTNESAITFNSSSRTDYKLAYFVDSFRTKDTGWQYFLDQFYPSLSLALQKNKRLKKNFYLNEYDIISYDPHKLVWDGISYTMVNKIVNFVSGKITKVELFKVS